VLYTKVLEAAFLFCQTLPVRVLLHQEASSSRLALQLYLASEAALAEPAVAAAGTVLAGNIAAEEPGDAVGLAAVQSLAGIRLHQPPFP
jgi:hypothetical protein